MNIGKKNLIGNVALSLLSLRNELYFFGSRLTLQFALTNQMCQKWHHTNFTLDINRFCVLPFFSWNSTTSTWRSPDYPIGEQDTTMASQKRPFQATLYLSAHRCISEPNRDQPCLVQINRTTHRWTHRLMGLINGCYLKYSKSGMFVTQQQPTDKEQKSIHGWFTTSVKAEGKLRLSVPLGSSEEFHRMSFRAAYLREEH
jgi:hypothetical protein